MRKGLRLPLAALLSLTAAAGCSTIDTAREIKVEPEQVIAPTAMPVHAMSIDIPVGVVRIEPSADQQLSARMSIYCPADDAGCAKRAAKTQFSLEPGAEQWHLSLTKLSRWYYRGMEVNADVQVPDGVDLHVKFGYGELDIVQGNGCVDVEMAAGDLHVRVPRQMVQQAHLDTNAGDALLRVEGRAVPGRRPWLVGAQTQWDQGSGRCAIDMSLGAGDLTVDLE